MIRSQGRTRLTATAVIIATMFVVATLPTPAFAQSAGALQGTASLPQFPGAGTGTFAGTATGLCNGSPSVLAGASASFTYSDTVPAVGTATGSLTVSGCGTFSFSWIRVGVTAVVTINGLQGAAVCGFAPTSVTVPPPGPATAAVACGFAVS
jgi:hypothetical protein